MLQPLRDAAKLAGNPLLGFAFVGPSGSVTAEYQEGDSAVYASFDKLVTEECDRISLNYAAGKLKLQQAEGPVFVHTGDWDTTRPFLYACIRNAIYTQQACWALYRASTFSKPGYVVKLITPTTKLEDL